MDGHVAIVLLQVDMMGKASVELLDGPIRRQSKKQDISDGVEVYLGEVRWVEVVGDHVANRN